MIDSQETAPPQAKKERTFGLKVVDAVIYGMNNIVVIGGSVALTYLTVNGDKVGGKFGQLVYNRGEQFKNKIMGISLGGKSIDEKQADGLKMVAFSFIDGSAFTPFVWLMEKFREKAARKVDEMAGTIPEDLSVYTAEPKQGFLSMAGGRVATLAIVLPTAIALGKLGTDNNTHKMMWNKIADNPDFTSLNDHFFNNPGKAAGEWLSKKPQLSDLAAKIDIPAIAKVGLFEGFYTSVCTTGLYLWSRAIASVTGKKEEKHITISPENIRAEAANNIVSLAPNVTKNRSFSSPSPSANNPSVVIHSASFTDRLHVKPEKALIPA